MVLLNKQGGLYSICFGLYDPQSPSIGFTQRPSDLSAGVMFSNTLYTHTRHAIQRYSAVFTLVHMYIF